MNAETWRRPLIVGASGQVGTQLFQALQDDGTAEVLRSSHARRGGWLQLDLAALRTATDAAAALGDVVPDLVLCPGAMTYVDGCEAEPERAFATNAHGPSALASYARQRELPFVFFSTDYVFSGNQEQPGPYTETHATHPLSVYGQSKLEGEQAVLRVHPEALIIRTSWVYGPDAAGKNFISSLRRQLRAGERMRVPLDQLSTPTFNRDLAQATLGLVRAKVSGIVHVTGPDLLSRYDLARRVARFFSLDEQLIEGVATASLLQRAARPLLSGLRSQRLGSTLPKLRLHTLEEGLAAVASESRADVAVAL